MCVIFVVNGLNGTRPTDTMVERAMTINPNAVGLAWREPGKGGRTEVVWRKGLITDVEEIQRLCKELPFPFVVHFRLQSVGAICDELAHPFPISKALSTALEGRTNGPVLFHNGTWKEFHSWVFEAAIKSGTEIPDGKWSDSRAMAFLASIYGKGLMEFLPEQKTVVFGADFLKIYGKPEWTKVDGILCSNNIFMTKQTDNRSSSSESYFRSRGDKSPTRFCKEYGCLAKDNLDKDDRCKAHPLASNPIRICKGNVSETGGSQKTVPFPQLAKGQVVSVELAKQLATEKVISKQLSKSIVKYHNQMNLGGHVATKAIGRLVAVSESLGRLLITNSLNGHAQ